MRIHAQSWLCLSFIVGRLQLDLKLIDLRNKLDGGLVIEHGGLAHELHNLCALSRQNG